MSIVPQMEAHHFVQAGFSYEELDPIVRERTMENERFIKDRERRTSEIILEIGNRLIATRDDLGNRKFKPWVESRLGWSIRTAYNFIAVADTFSIHANFAQIQPSALYALASNSVPDDIREGFVAIAEAGEKVTHSAVKEAITARREEEQRRVMLVDADSGEILDDEADDEPAPLTAEDIRERFNNAPSVPPPIATNVLAAPSVPAKNVHVSNNSGENEWYTPPQYIEAAREVMGAIDLDPASSEVADRTVKAGTFYTKDDNGLGKEWYGRVWMNPPYAQPLIQYFAEKIVDEYDEGNIDEAVVLVNNATETKWFQALARAATAICFPMGRIKYLDATGTPANTPLQGQAFLYFGPNQGRFIAVFEKFGVVR